MAEYFIGQIFAPHQLVVLVKTSGLCKVLLKKILLVQCNRILRNLPFKTNEKTLPEVQARLTEFLHRIYPVESCK